MISVSTHMFPFVVFSDWAIYFEPGRIIRFCNEWVVIDDQPSKTHHVYSKYTEVLFFFVASQYFRLHNIMPDEAMPRRS